MNHMTLHVGVIGLSRLVTTLVLVVLVVSLVILKHYPTLMIWHMIWRVKMTKIPYEHGEMNIDIVKFLVNRNLNDIRYLCKNIIAISPKKLDIKNEICYTIRAMRDGDIERPRFYKSKDYEQFEKKMTRMIECLDKYVKEEE